MKLSDRKKQILKIVVNDYIKTAQPVSSKQISDKYMTDLSSATVRAELAQLEELGYLTHVHTSSGRVPSKDAYKLYVDELMSRGKLTVKELSFIKEQFRKQTSDIESVVKNTVKIISELTDYTSLAYSTMSKEDKILNVKIFRFKPTVALLLIVTENTLIRDKVIRIPEDMTDEEVENANEIINRMFTGKSFGEVLTYSDKIESEFIEFREIFERIIEVLEDYVSSSSGSLFLEGEDKIMNHPEYSDVEKVKNFLSVVNSKEKVVDLLGENKNNIEISIKIGSEDDSIPKDCSLVTASYSAGGVNIGSYGVIGPIRMDYQKVVSVLEGVGKILEEMLKDE
ncbi:MAG: heat-inducible transcription repressor HrcA [Clostridia bacterium]|nr:heat-inducible transcription repressor HrcA [Clostridia bacterium]